jgi:hypothetical protein
VVQRLIDEGANALRVTADKLALNDPGVVQALHFHRQTGDNLALNEKTTQLLAVTILTADNVALSQPTLTRAVIVGRLVADNLAVAEPGPPSVQIG